jgi:hypothetical protein
MPGQKDLAAPPNNTNSPSAAFSTFLSAFFALFSVFLGYLFSLFSCLAFVFSSFLAFFSVCVSCFACSFADVQFLPEFMAFFQLSSRRVNVKFGHKSIRNTIAPHSFVYPDYVTKSVSGDAEGRKKILETLPV